MPCACQGLGKPRGGQCVAEFFVLVEEDVGHQMIGLCMPKIAEHVNTHQHTSVN